MDGIMVVDKPAGWTSHDVVAKVRSILRQELRIENRELAIKNQSDIPNSQFPIPHSKAVKVGHTGTLDPMATGLLVLVIGSYTKRAGQFSKLDKTYEAELTLGATSTTGDREGKLISVSDKIPSKLLVKNAIAQFTRTYEQTPPQYSAIKVAGQRAYKAARAGKAIKIEPRQVRIYGITNVNYEYPKLKFTTKVSSGTYIRSLAADIGEKLGTGAYLSALRRTQVGDFKIENALKISDLTIENIASNITL